MFIDFIYRNEIFTLQNKNWDSISGEIWTGFVQKFEVTSFFQFIPFLLMFLWAWVTTSLKTQDRAPAGIYLIKFNNKNTGMQEICSKLLIKSP